MLERNREAVASLLEEAAAVLQRVREVYPDCWERFGQRDFLVDELEGCAGLVRIPDNSNSEPL